jgi:hypothetical protein
MAFSSTKHTEILPRIPQHNTPPSRSAESATTTVGPQAGTTRHTLPATIEEAIAMNPALAKDLACRDSQAKYGMDYQLRMIAGVRDCLADRAKSTGRIAFMLHFDVSGDLPATGLVGRSPRGAHSFA